MSNSTPRAQESFSNTFDHFRNLAKSINRLLDGHGNNVIDGGVTLTAGATSTVVVDSRLERDSVIVLVPTTANAAGALATTYQTYPNTVTGQATINHANAGTTDRTFGAVIQG